MISQRRSFAGLASGTGLALAGLLVLTVGGCSPSTALTPAGATQPAAPIVSSAARPANAAIAISSPTAGQVIQAGPLKVSIKYSGPMLVPRADAKKLDDFHLHYFLDEDSTQYIATPRPIPTGNQRIVHSAATEVTFDNVSAGTHTVAVLMSGNNHVPVSPPLSDTATFTAR